MASISRSASTSTASVPLPATALTAFRQRLERGYLVHHPGHALPAAGVGLVDQVRPVAGGAPMGGHPLADRIVSQVASLGVPADQRQGLGYRPVGGVVAAELQDLQQRDQPASVVTGIGGPKRGLHRAPVHRPLGLELVNQLPQRLLPAGHSREYHLPHRVIGALPARDDLAIAVGRGEGAGGLLDAAGPHVVEGSWLYRLTDPGTAAAACPRGRAGLPRSHRWPSTPRRP